MKSDDAERLGREAAHLPDRLTLTEAARRRDAAQATWKESLRGGMNSALSFGVDREDEGVHNTTAAVIFWVGYCQEIVEMKGLA